jgi:hypothetical protein
MEEQTVKSPKVLEFLTVANEFCLLAEEPAKYPRETMLGYMQRILPLLYLKGSLLPVVDPPEEEDLYERFVTEADWEACYMSWKEMMGKDDPFWHIPHHHEQEPQPQQGSVAEYIADIYQDSKDFLMLFQKPLTASRLHAIAACRYLFFDHWGSKALIVADIIHKTIHPCCDQNHTESPTPELT